MHPSRRTKTHLTMLSVLLTGLYTATGVASENYQYPRTLVGQDTPAERCVVCHSLEKGGEHRVAPNLWNIVDADIARDQSWYAYSPGLIRKEGRWTEENLSNFRKDAEAFSHGSTKSIRVADAKERQKIIDELKKYRD